ncbi:hypothetical protein F5X68DRAFT_212725 [Plectosphaerella plurivora]|uniref:Uncharacterized protein n=1 Tax=Plectosphaerella plurivora TaxID=936078 RepID=A0A9P8V671_9PEZI|nr:hypothetical protein F5X68DRAFT_212725 [Plectosphaerella plurivora]
MADSAPVWPQDDATLAQELLDLVQNDSRFRQTIPWANEVNRSLERGTSESSSSPPASRLLSLSAASLFSPRIRTCCTSTVATDNTGPSQRVNHLE